MTATAAPQTKDNPRASSPVNFVGLVLALLLIGAYALLPLVHQPELGATTAFTVLASRSNNELEIPTSGLPLIPMAGLGALCIGLWNVLDPKAARVAGVLLVVTGIISFVYFIIFVQDYIAEEAAYLGSMGAAFWAILIINVALVLQVFLPRPPAEPYYQPLKVLGNQESVLIFGLLALIIVVGVANPRFVAERNLSDIITGHAYIAIAAIGMSMVIITGNIDISVGSLVGVLATISGNISLTKELPLLGAVPVELVVILAWVIPVILGGMYGAFVGFLVAYLRIPAIVVTLGMLSILKGGLIFVTAGERVVDMPAEYFLTQMRPLNIPLPIFLMVILTILAAMWMRYSATGRALYAVGGNKEAARLSGIGERTITIQVFILNGVFTGIASLLYATQGATIQATPPPNLELLIITASVVGGVSILGGIGTVIGSTVAAILLNVIRSAMIFINVSPFWLQAVQGIMILLTVLADLFRRRRQA